MLLFTFTFFLPVFTTVAYVVGEVYLFTAVLVVFLRQMESIPNKTCLCPTSLVSLLLFYLP